MTKREKCFALLQLKPTATDAEIKRQYKRMALKLHPDVNPDPKANEQFIALTIAVEFLLYSKKENAVSNKDKRESRKSTEETAEQKAERMAEAKSRYDKQRASKIHEDNVYYEQLTTGKKWRIFMWVTRVGILLSITLSLDLILPHHFTKDEVIAYAGINHTGIIHRDICAIQLQQLGFEYVEAKRSSWSNDYPIATVESTWILHTPIAFYLSDDETFNRTGFDFHLGAIRWILIVAFLVPLITKFRKRKDLTFVFLYQFCFWGIGLLECYLLLTEGRLGHLLSLGFL